MEVKIYSSPLCPWCKKVKEFLTENKIKYTDLDVSKDQKIAQESIDKSGQTGVPVTVIGDKVIVGFDEDKLKEALKL
jgi:glutaredoxin 3